MRPSCLLRRFRRPVLRLTREEIPDEGTLIRAGDTQPIKETKIAELDISEIEN